MVAMATTLFTVYCKLFHMMPYIIILKVRKFHQPTESRFSTARKKPVGGRGYIVPPSLNRVNSAMQQYFIVTGRHLGPLPPEPVLSDFYVPSEDHHNRELAFITLSMVGIGAFLWYSNK